MVDDISVDEAVGGVIGTGIKDVIGEGGSRGPGSASSRRVAVLGEAARRLTSQWTTKQCDDPTPPLTAFHHDIVPATMCKLVEIK